MTFKLTRKCISCGSYKFRHGTHKWSNGNPDINNVIKCGNCNSIGPDIECFKSLFKVNLKNKYRIFGNEPDNKNKSVYQVKYKYDEKMDIYLERNRRGGDSDNSINPIFHKKLE